MTLLNYFEQFEQFYTKLQIWNLKKIHVTLAYFDEMYSPT